MNVATGKTYSQSSTYFSQGPSSNAANGNTGGFYDNSNCIHTNVSWDNASDPQWWQVDLGRTYPVYTIEVWARDGCELLSIVTEKR